MSLFHKEINSLLFLGVNNETLEKYFEASVSIFPVEGGWFVPIAKQIGQWENITIIFEPIVWLSILIVLITNGIAWWILGRNREKEAPYKELSLCLMGSLYILLQGSLAIPKAWKLRFVVIIWSISSLMLFTAHQCQLTGILTSPMYEHQISNTKELVDSKLGCGYYEPLKVLFSDKTNRVYQKMLEKHVNCDLTMECANRTAFQRDVAVLKNRREIQYLIPKWYLSKNGKPLLYSFKENQFSLWGKIYAIRGFPIMPKMNEYLLLLRANGLIEKWDMDVSTVRKDDKDYPKIQTLSLDHLQAAFYLLGFGVICSTLMFIGEICYDKVNRRKVEINFS